MSTIKTPEDFSPVLRFAVASDAHIKAPGDEACRLIEKMLVRSYALAGEDKAHSSLDALIMDGDIANSAEDEQFNGFFEALANAKKDETRFLGIIAKYHDCDKQRLTPAKFTARTGQPTDFHTVINGFHFIGISVCPAPEVFHYSDEQKAWLEREIAAAVQDTPLLPVFVFQHEHVRDTVFGSTLFDGWGEIYFSDIFKKYSNIVNISGHSHYPAADPRAIWQGEFTALNDGGLSYFEFTFDGERKYHPENAADMAQFLLIEADNRGAVRVRTYDLHEDTVAFDHFIENAANPAAFAYRPENRAEKAPPPRFGEDAEIHTERTGNGVKITVPPALTSEDDRVFLYRLVIKDKEEKTVVTDSVLSDYYYRTTPRDILFSPELPAGKYTVFVTAESVWGKTSDALTAGIIL